MTCNPRGPRFLPGIDPRLLGLCLLGLVAPLCGAEQGSVGSPHRIEVCQPVFSPEDGLLLGNGDLSVSVYQAADRIVWRFGKGDVWDRRLDLSDDPKPAHISEIVPAGRAVSRGPSMFGRAVGTGLCDQPGGDGGDERGSAADHAGRRCQGRTGHCRGGDQRRRGWCQSRIAANSDRAGRPAG